MRKFTFIFFAFLFFKSSFSQVTKGNWLVGGSGSFYSSTSVWSPPSFTQKSKDLNLSFSTNLGYFLVDRFAVGLSPAFSWGKGQGGESIDANGTVVGSGGYSNTKRYLLGPFVRYYFLDTEKPFNLFAAVAYQRGITSIKPTTGSIEMFSAAVGPVIYFNSSVGLEFTIGYSSSVEELYHISRKGFQAGIGFQIHLEK